LDRVKGYEAIGRKRLISPPYKFGIEIFKLVLKENLEVQCSKRIALVLSGIEVTLI